MAHQAPELTHRPSVEVEKYETPEHIEYDDTKAELGGEVTGIDAGFEPAMLKRLVRRIDFRLIPILSLMYLISIVDRTNLAIARAANNVYMDKELHLKVGDRYSIITCIFFVPYILFELPSQIGLRKFGARVWLPGAVFCWGAIMLGMGFVQNWGALAALRARCSPERPISLAAGIRKEMAQRNVVFYITSAVGGSFAKPLGYVFSLLHRKGGRSGWQWIFIIYGCVTMLIAGVGYFFIVDFPDKATFLTEEEKRIVQLRIERDRADSKPDPLTAAKVKKYMLTGQPWLFAFFFFANATATYAMSYFLPTILQGMGFTNVESMMLGTPMYVWALIPALGCGRISDRIRGSRGLCIAFNALSVVVGTAMFSQIPASNKAARFVGVFIAVGGAQANTPLVISWQHTAIRAQSKRAYCSALIVAAGGAGGILGSTAFVEKEAKKGYPTGIYVTLAINAASTLGCCALALYYHFHNKKADRGDVVIEEHDDFRYQP